MLSDEWELRDRSRRQAGTRAESTRAQNDDDVWACLSEGLELKRAWLQQGWEVSRCVGRSSQLQADKQVIC